MNVEPKSGPSGPCGSRICGVLITVCANNKTFINKWKKEFGVSPKSTETRKDLPKKY